MKNLGININTSKENYDKILEDIVKYIYDKDKSIKVSVFKDSNGLEAIESMDLDALIVLGGDGTILSTSRIIAKYNVPILGINIGNLGFLAQVDSEKANLAIDELLKGDYEIEERIMLQGTLEKNGIKSFFPALNDLVLSKGTLARIVKYSIYVDNKFYTTFAADGVIVSTATGSTAYSLSAGGPIMYPNLSLFSITPICPHSIGIRTMVIDSKSSIRIKVDRKYESVFLTVDGQEFIEIGQNNFIDINIYSFKCKLIRFKDYNYFDVLRKKITTRTKECEGEE